MPDQFPVINKLTRQPFSFFLPFFLLLSPFFRTVRFESLARVVPVSYGVSLGKLIRDTSGPGTPVCSLGVIVFRCRFYLRYLGFLEEFDEGRVHIFFSLFYLRVMTCLPMPVPFHWMYMGLRGCG